MVGVPRSKGCANCRKRKVACDQERPQCRVCVKRGVPCEGYARYPVVLQWTTTGLMKRQRFEEVAPASTSPESSASSTTPISLTYTGGTSTADDHVNTVLPRQPPLNLFLLEQMLVRCLQSYLPRDGSAISDVKSNWMWRIADLPARGKVLGSSSSALSLARMGKVKGDQNLILQARTQYALALTHLQTALYHPEQAFQDRTLAAIRTLSIYELLSPTFAPMPPGKTHEDGMAQWCRAAGPQSINTDFGLLVFEDVRWSIMIHAIDRSTSSILGDEEWRTVPWKNFTKDCLQRLYDHGFAIGALLEQINRGDDNRCPANVAYLSSVCLDIMEQIEDWYKEFWGTIDEHTILLMGGLFEATNMLYFWWFKLALNEAILILHPSSSAIIEPSNSTSAPSAQDLANLSLQRNNVRLASDIVSAAPFFSAEDTGWLGPQRMLFPLKKAMVELRKARSPLFPEAQAVFVQLVQKMKTC